MRKLLLILAGTALAAGIAQAEEADTYEVTVTNISSGQTFTPILAVTHKLPLALFQPGEPASAELATLAESGDIAPLAASLDPAVQPAVFDTSSTDGLLEPGQSVTLMIQSTRPFNRISFAAMLIPTNDTFVTLHQARLPEEVGTYRAFAWDAGSEVSDELCDNIPGPVCEGEGESAADGEGYVHISSGIHGIGDLDPGDYDWRNPVAAISIRRLGDH